MFKMSHFLLLLLQSYVNLEAKIISRVPSKIRIGFVSTRRLPRSTLYVIFLADNFRFLVRSFVPNFLYLFLYCVQLLFFDIVLPVLVLTRIPYFLFLLLPILCHLGSLLFSLASFFSCVFFLRVVRKRFPLFSFGGFVGGLKALKVLKLSIFSPISPRKPPKTSKKILYIGSQFTVVRSKTTRIRSKIPQNDNDFFDFIPDNLNLYRKSRSRLRNRVKIRQKIYYTNVTIFSTLDRNFEILEFFQS